HTNEDVGIALGEAFKKALGDKKGIKRFGASSVPMDEALAEVSLDISGRPSLYLQANLNRGAYELKNEGSYDLKDAKHFIQSFVGTCGINMHIKAVGEDMHHILEAIFKALARAMYDATQLDERVKGIPSTKGKL
ncbi:MAG: imidazoleglycerol-phosphate dehydratase, partial [Candidatus Omnitrophica bacterium]|nr:imidazoleglycerol-phosphate dehydratase [Candidatus Omnitrophota bacterium]